MAKSLLTTKLISTGLILGSRIEESKSFFKKRIILSNCSPKIETKVYTTLAV